MTFVIRKHCEPTAKSFLFLANQWSKINGQLEGLRSRLYDLLWITPSPLAPMLLDHFMFQQRLGP